jgi:hypothetical protein
MQVGSGSSKQSAGSIRSSMPSGSQEHQR